jgi:EAL and modified HD-GYP domain-containing signal transduction protein
MARQAIYDARRQITGYELLYRNGRQLKAGDISPEQSAQALMNSLVDIGLGRLAGDRPAFINVDSELICSPALYLLPPAKVVLELLETVEPTTEALEAIKGLRDAGYKIALDDFVANENALKFVPYADIVKFDVLALGPSLTKHVQIARTAKLTMLAEKVETRAAFDNCLSFGIKLFQGFYFSNPEVVQGRSVPPNRLATIQLLAQLQSPSVTLDEIERLVTTDLALSHRLLRLVKSAQYALPEKMATIRAALMFLGAKAVAALASVLAMSACSDKAPSLMVTALARAKMCEFLAPKNRQADKTRFFTAGLFSVLDAILDIPMQDVLAQIVLEEEVATALLDHDAKNEVATALRTVIAFETADWESIEFGPLHIADAYYDAVDWAEGTAHLAQHEDSAAA